MAAFNITESFTLMTSCLALSIYPFTLYPSIPRAGGSLEPNPVDIGWKAGYPLDKSLVCLALCADYLRFYIMETNLDDKTQ